jgi:hypothetical protein
MIISNCQTAEETWKSYHVLLKTGLQRKIHLKKELQNLMYVSCKNMDGLINKVTTVQQQLRTMGASIPEEELTVMILMKLPEKYQPLVMALDSMEPDKLTLDMVTSSLLQEEARQHAMKC